VNKRFQRFFIDGADGDEIVPKPATLGDQAVERHKDMLRTDKPGLYQQIS